MTKFNELMDFTVNQNVIKMESKLNEGLEFEVELKSLTDNAAKFNINYIYDKKKNKKMQSPRLTKKYSSWITSILFKCKEEGIISL